MINEYTHYNNDSTDIKMYVVNGNIGHPTLALCPNLDTPVKMSWIHHAGNPADPCLLGLIALNKDHGHDHDI